MCFCMPNRFYTECFVNLSYAKYMNETKQTWHPPYEHLVIGCTKMQYEYYRHFSEIIALTVTCNIGCRKISWKSKAI